MLPYSDGMDSRAVAGLLGRELGNRLVRVRVGAKSWDQPRNGAFARAVRGTVPYSVPLQHAEPGIQLPGGAPVGSNSRSSAALPPTLRTRKRSSSPKAGRARFGPALLNVGHAYPDYRNHPLFGRRMAAFINALLGTRIRFVYPRIWSTKGATLRDFAALDSGRRLARHAFVLAQQTDGARSTESCGNAEFAQPACSGG